MIARWATVCLDEKWIWLGVEVDRGRECYFLGIFNYRNNFSVKTSQIQCTETYYPPSQKLIWRNYKKLLKYIKFTRHFHVEFSSPDFAPEKYLWKAIIQHYHFLVILRRFPSTLLFLPFQLRTCTCLMLFSFFRESFMLLCLIYALFMQKRKMLQHKICCNLSSISLPATMRSLRRSNKRD